MENPTIIELIASVASVDSVVEKNVQTLSLFRTQYTQSAAITAMLIAQSCTAQAALKELVLWSAECLGYESAYQSVADHFDAAVSGFCPLVTQLRAGFSIHELEEKSKYPLESRSSCLLDRSFLEKHLDMLESQVDALTLLLKALQSETPMDVGDLLAKPENVTVVASAIDSSKTLFLASSIQKSTPKQGGRPASPTTTDEPSNASRTAAQSNGHGKLPRTNTQETLPPAYAEATTSGTRHTNGISGPSTHLNLPIRQPQPSSSSSSSSKAPPKPDASSTTTKADPLTDELERYSIVDYNLIKLVSRRTTLLYPIIFRTESHRKTFDQLAEISVIKGIDISSGPRIGGSIPNSNPNIPVLGLPFMTALAWLAERFEEVLDSMKAVTYNTVPHLSTGLPGFLIVSVQITEGRDAGKLGMVSVQLKIPDLADLDRKQFVISCNI